MSDLLSALDKQNIHAMFDDVHDTFARDITIYILEDAAIIDTDGNHNPIFDDNPDQNPQVLKSYATKARIKYNGAQDRIYNGGDSQNNISLPNGSIRLKVDVTAYDLIRKAKKIKIDDRLCELIGGPSRPGPFNPNYWTIELKQID